MEQFRGVAGFFEGREAASGDNFRRLEDARIFEFFGAVAAELHGEGADGGGGFGWESGEPLRVLVHERLGAILARLRGEAVAEFGEHIVEVVGVEASDLLDDAER